MTASCIVSASVKRRFCGASKSGSGGGRSARRRRASIKDRRVSCSRYRPRSMRWSAVSAAIYAVRSAVWLVVAKTIAGLNSIDAAAAYGLRFVWAWIRHLALYVAGSIWRGVRFVGTMGRSLAVSVWIAAVGGRCGDRRQGRTRPRPRSAISFRSASAVLPPEPGMCRAQSAEGLARDYPASRPKPMC